MGRARFSKSSASVFMLSNNEAEFASDTATVRCWVYGEGSFSDRGRLLGRSVDSMGSEGNSDMAGVEF